MPYYYHEPRAATILHKNVVRKRWEYAVTRAASEIARSGYRSGGGRP